MAKHASPDFGSLIANLFTPKLFDQLLDQLAPQFDIDESVPIGGIGGIGLGDAKGEGTAGPVLPGFPGARPDLSGMIPVGPAPQEDPFPGLLPSESDFAGLSDAGIAAEPGTQAETIKKLLAAFKGASGALPKEQATPIPPPVSPGRVGAFASLPGSGNIVPGAGGGASKEAMAKALKSLLFNF